MPAAEFDSTVSCLPLSLTLQCHVCCWVWLRGVMPAAEFDSAVSCLLLSLTSRCHACRRVWLRGVMPATECDCEVWSLPLRLIPRCHTCRCVWLHSIGMTPLCNAHHGVCIGNFFKFWLTGHAHRGVSEKFQFFGNIETVFEYIKTVFFMGPGGIVWWEKPVVEKSSGTLPQLWLWLLYCTVVLVITFKLFCIS